MEKMAMDRITPLFTATASAIGGRNGHTETSDGAVKSDLSVPKEMGGPGKPGLATPEHLFAAGYAACFGGSLDYVAKQNKRDVGKAKVTCAVTVGLREGGGFGLAVKMRVEDRSLPQAELATFAREAHEKICPYSHATRGNVDVTLEVIGG
jgi:lipoyl-dependent peroxiredoxin